MQENFICWFILYLDYRFLEKPKPFDYSINSVIWTHLAIRTHHSEQQHAFSCLMKVEGSSSFKEAKQDFELRLGGRFKHFITLLISSAVLQPVTDHSRLSP